MSCANQAKQMSECMTNVTGTPSITSGVPTKKKEWWELTEKDYFAWVIEKEFDKAKSNAAFFQRLLNEPETRKKYQAKYQDVDRLRRNADYWNNQASQYQQMKVADLSENQRVRWRVQYIKSLKDKLRERKGDLPPEVIAQYPELQKAKSNYEVYLKGRRTSFHRDTAAVNYSLVDTRGVQVKRQDGKAITPKQIAEIEQGLNEIEAVFGDLSRVMRTIGLGVAHTSGKHPFLSTAMGLYSTAQRVVSTGTISKINGKPFPSLAHEIGHALDYEAGNLLDVSVSVTNKSGKTQPDRISSLAEYEGRSYSESSALLALAKQKMRDTYTVSRYFRKGYKPANEEDAVTQEIVKVSLGHYWQSPREIWARLCEQYISTKLAQHPDYAGAPLVAVRRDYTQAVAYWSKEDWAKLEPMVEQEINRRLDLIKGGADAAALYAETPRATAVKSLSYEGLPGNWTKRQFKMQSGYSNRVKSLDVVEVNPGEWGVYSQRRVRKDGSFTGYVYEVTEIYPPTTQENARILASNALLTRVDFDEQGRQVILDLYDDAE